jgi:predicted transcriptional regulator
VSEDPPSEKLFALLDDEYARTILTKTSEQPMSAKALGDACDASLPTIYRRIDRLLECDLLVEQTEFQNEGRHYSIYEARLERVTVELADGALNVTMTTKEKPDPADRFTDIWEDIR